MIDAPVQIKIQSYLDGELSSKDRSRVEIFLDRDAEARLLLDELKTTRAALMGNEVELILPESREFFWSKIEREILAEGKSPPFRIPWWVWAGGRKWIASLAGVTAMLVFLLLNAKQFGARPAWDEIESSLEEMGTFTFRDQAAGVTLVWVYDRDTDQSLDTSGVDDFEPQ